MLEARGRNADTSWVRKRLRSEGGFGLVELLIAMVMLNIGLLAVVASFSSGIVSLNRASRITTAAVIADQQMELYRALTHSSIRLDTSSVGTTDAKYVNDPVLGGSTAGLVTASCAGPPFECNPSRKVVGADRKDYRLDTYITAVHAHRRPPRQEGHGRRARLEQPRRHLRPPGVDLRHLHRVTHGCFRL